MLLGVIGVVSCFSGVSNNINGLNEENSIRASKVNAYEEQVKKAQTFEKGTELIQQVHFGIQQVSTTENGTSLSIVLDTTTNNSTNNFYIGYSKTGDKVLPATLEYQIKDVDNAVRTEQTAIIKSSTINPYDGLGNRLGTTEFTTFCDIVHPVGSVVDLDSVLLCNIFDYDAENKVADFNNPHYVKGVVEDGYKSFNYNELLDIKYSSLSTFAGYNSYGFSSFSTAEDAYENLGTKYKKLLTKYEAELASGEFYLRSLITFSGDSKLHVTFNDGSSKNYSVESTNVSLTNKSPIFLLFNDFNNADVKSIQLFSTFLSLSIYQPAVYKDVSGTSISIRFGFMNLGFEDLKDSTGKVIYKKVDNYGVFNGNLFLIISTAVLFAIYGGIATGLYFYLKQKNKNNEFKRMRTKSYIKTNSIGFLYASCFLLFVEFVILRFGFISTSFAIYNPADIYIIVFGVASIILTGYFVKFFAVAIKNGLERRRVSKLKVTYIDDGTLNVNGK